EKRSIIDESRVNKTVYWPASSFYKSKPLIASNPIFKIIKSMPKGGALHLHNQATTSHEWMVKNLTYRDSVYMYTGTDGFVRLGIFKNPPSNNPWKLIKSERAAAIDRDKFDENIIRSLSLLTVDPLEVYPTVNEAWGRFNIYFSQPGDLLYNADIMRDYYRQTLEEFFQDNVQYIEMRDLFTEYIDLDGVPYNASYIADMFQSVTEEFVSQHPEFLGAKLIMSGLRFSTQAQMLEKVKIAMLLRKKFPSFVVGFDMEAREDTNNPLKFFMEPLLYPRNKLPYYFHAAETDWQESQVDDNMFDALLLNTRRIGDGFGLAKHPVLLQFFREHRVAVEVNPLSHHLLGLVADLRDHPATQLMTEDYPVVISSDNPATWEATPLSHDFFVAFMNMCGRDTGLTFLKQLALNSFEYSAMNDYEKSVVKAVWQKKWDEFVKKSVEEYL
ncbi:hypothetical protein Btru_032080, partial [Bulinus truncatus]